MGARSVGRDMRPAAQSLSFASPKESNQRKGDPAVCVPSLRCGQPALLSKRGRYANSLRSNMRLADPRFAALLGAYRGGSPDTKSNSLNANLTRTRHGASLWALAFVFGICLLSPRRHEETRSAGAAGSGLALFERSEFSQTPAAPSIAVCPRSGPTNPARLLFAYFLLAKQEKVSRPPGRDPAYPAGQANIQLPTLPPGRRPDQAAHSAQGTIRK